MTKIVYMIFVAYLLINLDRIYCFIPKIRVKNMLINKRDERTKKNIKSIFLNLNFVNFSNKIIFTKPIIKVAPI